MNIFDPLVATRVIIVLGIINLLSGILVFLSCRCLGGSKIGTRLMKNKSFARFYRYHCHIWKVFWASVFLHTVLVMVFLGWPS
ncbi:MAG: hypothetical protein HY529_06330 [Chloroflexi bacterium]|nr:hypothetical protein [Chloroflexota bacterium]